jgi:hypothetical protein
VTALVSNRERGTSTGNRDNFSLTVDGTPPGSPYFREQRVLPHDSDEENAMSENESKNPDYPVRAGVFSSGDAALQALHRLRDAGFTREEISVVATEEAMKKHFPKDMPDEMTTEPAGSHTSDALNKAGLGALGLGVVGGATALVTTAGTAMIVLGAMAGLAVAGTFVSVMATRGVESSAADYFDQAVQAGKILVAVEVSGDDDEAQERRKQAESIISSSGADPLQLSH